MKTQSRKKQESDIKITAYAGIVVIVISIVTFLSRYVFHIM
jgi:hypothetical protein